MYLGSIKLISLLKPSFWLLIGSMSLAMQCIIAFVMSFWCLLVGHKCCPCSLPRANIPRLTGAWGAFINTVAQTQTSCMFQRVILLQMLKKVCRITRLRSHLSTTIFASKSQTTFKLLRQWNPFYQSFLCWKLLLLHGYHCHCFCQHHSFFVVNSGYSITRGAKWFLVVYLSMSILSLLYTFLLRHRGKMDCCT